MEPEHSFTILNYYRGYGYWIFIFMTSYWYCSWFIWSQAFIQEHNLQLNVVTVAKIRFSLEWPSVGLFPKTHYGEKSGLPVHVHEHVSLWSLGFPVWRIRGYEGCGLDPEETGGKKGKLSGSPFRGMLPQYTTQGPLSYREAIFSSVKEGTTTWRG